MGFFSTVMQKLFGSANERFLKALQPKVAQINALEPQFKHLSDTQLRDTTAGLKKRLADGQTLDQILPEAFAAVREAGRRFLNMRHYDVQLIGGMVLHAGRIAEMVTGEGKTLVATLSAYLNALTGKGVHVVTVNDYLAQRDCDWMAPIYRGLGLTVGAIQSNMGSEERQPHYASDITYGTNNEFGFDYLRDNMKARLTDQVQGPLHYAIIDEVDSILIDEARTPLIISGSADEQAEKYRIADRAVRVLGKPDPKTLENEYFKIDEKDRRVDLSEEGQERISKELGIDNIWSGANMEWPHLIANALKAHHIFKREKDYVNQEGEIKIVDEFTGRILEGRRWSEGLHQAIEAKEERETNGAVRVREEQHTLASITLQNYFKLYEKLAGMTGTAMTEAAEFYKIYKLDVVAIPTNRRLIRRPINDLVFGSEAEKYEAIINELDFISTLGRPTLVGTTSIERSEQISKLLRDRRFRREEQAIAEGKERRFYVLNARVSYENQYREADIVAQAGRRLLPENLPHELEQFAKTVKRGSVEQVMAEVAALGRRFKDSPGMISIATNMAGRGTDILLGGNPAHFYFNFLRGEQGLEELTHRQAEKKKKDGDKVDTAAPPDLFSELHGLLKSADALPYPMKDPATLFNRKERDGTQRAVAEATLAMINLPESAFTGDSAKRWAPLFEGFLDPGIFDRFFTDPAWRQKISDFLGRELEPTKDADVARKAVVDLIRLTIPIDDYLDRQIALRAELLKAQNRGTDHWVTLLTQDKWKRRLRRAEEVLRDCMFNKFMVLCPQFFNFEALGLTPGQLPTEQAKVPFWFEEHLNGGLHILGTERHESRRIDNQLRGRCGRQGDPGSSQFFLSLDDDLMRIFAGGRIKNFLQMVGLKNGQPIQAGMVTRSVERAQKKVEARNFDVRKNLLDYDEVMDKQRKSLYTLRQGVLEGLTNEPNPHRYRVLRITRSQRMAVEATGDTLDYTTWREWWDETGREIKRLPEGDHWETIPEPLRHIHLRETALKMLHNRLARLVEEYSDPATPAQVWKLDGFVMWFNREFAGFTDAITTDEISRLSLKDLQARLHERVLWDRDPRIDRIKAMTSGLRKTDLKRDGFVQTFQNEFGLTLDDDELAEVEQLSPKTAAAFFVEKYRLKCRRQREADVGARRLEELGFQISEATGGWDVPALCRWMKNNLLIEIAPEDLRDKTRDQAEEFLAKKAVEKYEERAQTQGVDVARFTDQFVLLDTIDRRWKDHLREMDFLRSAVAFSGMAQRDPKVEYKIRGLENFRQMLTMIEDQFSERILRAQLFVDDQLLKSLAQVWAGGSAQKENFKSSAPPPSPASSPSAARTAGTPQSGASTSGGDKTRQEFERAAKQPMSNTPSAPIRNEFREPKPNEPCPCGSGKKYKKCHGVPGAPPLPPEVLRKLG